MAIGPGPVSEGGGSASRGGAPGTRSVVRVLAPAKVTASLRIEGRRTDGYHLIRAEMLTVDLCDELEIFPGETGLHLEGALEVGVPVATGSDNLVTRALDSTGRRARVVLRKRIPAGGGLGGGSADAAAVLRWAGCTDPAVGASLGADVPFCMVGGRAMVTGLGEQVAPLDFESRTYVLLIPPFGVHTGSVYGAFDELGGGGRSVGDRAQTADPGQPADPGQTADPGGAGLRGVNDLTAAALCVEPRLAAWRDALAEATGRAPMLAGSGSTWFVDGSLTELGLSGTTSLWVGGSDGPLLEVRTVPAGWGMAQG